MTVIPVTHNETITCKAHHVIHILDGKIENRSSENRSS